MSATTSATIEQVPPEIVSSVFYTATVSDSMAMLVAETVGSTQRITWGNEGAVTMLGYALEDLRGTKVNQLLPFTARG